MPELLIDKRKCLDNIERMIRKASRHNLSFRPHFKTHQSVEIGNWFYDLGITRITVSSFRMAAYFARAGWSDILVAFPFNPEDRNILHSLPKKTTISLLLDNRETLAFLEGLPGKVNYYIDIDTGYGRTGIDARDTKAVEALIGEAEKNKQLIFKGFYCHAGHSYKTTDPSKQDAIHLKAIGDLARLKQEFSALSPLVLYGDTPGCSRQENFSGVDEITPGNFVFYDLMQYHLGSCSLNDIAVILSCPVTGKYPDRERMVIHGGAVHFSKDSLDLDGRRVFGLVKGTGCYLSSLSQEHGILEHCGSLFGRTRIGDRLEIYPVHSCLAANLMQRYRTREGEWIETMNN